ncbi:methyltransferase domain-containing protein [bacterium]|nr:methyltransferase domain-containing protein [bacterium]
MNMQKFWDSYYEQAFNTGVQADPRFVSVMETLNLPAARAVDLGAGEGGDSFWLAEHGWNVTAVDFAESGVNRLQTTAEQRKLPITVVQADMLSYDPAEAPDLVHLGYIHLEPAQRKRLFHRIRTMLNPAGVLCYIGMTDLKPDQLPPGVSANLFAELESILPLVAGMDVLIAEQGPCKVDMGNGPEHATGVTLVARKRK